MRGRAGKTRSGRDACKEIAEKFSAIHPELPSQVFVAETGDGFPSPARGGVRYDQSAVLLAAGRGKRQRPYTDVTPKPCLK